MGGETTTHVVLDLSNNLSLEDKVLIGGGSIVTNMATVEDTFGELAN